jgi:hypothetical protein
MGTLKEPFKRAHHICRTEGLRGLLGRVYRFLVRRYFEYSTYYLYAKPVPRPEELNDAQPIPRADGLMPRLVSSNEEVDELEAQGFEFRSHVPNARERLDQGAVATCVFVGKELAHIGWVALNQRALDSLNEPPYKVDFANKEAVGTGAWTSPRHRGKGLTNLGAILFHMMAHDNGIETRRYAIRKSNIPSIKVQERVSDPCGEGRYLRVLWWKSWKERSLPQERR